MRVIASVVLVAVMMVHVGCGGSSSNANATSKKVKKQTPKESTAVAQAPPPRPKKPKIVVPADAYPGVPQALQAYTEALKANNADEADRVEGWLETTCATSIPALSGILSDSSSPPETQLIASRALGRCGPTASKALIDAIAGVKVEQVRIKAIESLSILKPASPESIQALHALMKHKESRVRQHAIQGLARIGPAAKDVVPDLMNVLNNTSENDTVRSAAKDALIKVDPRKGFHGMKLD